LDEKKILHVLLESYHININNLELLREGGCVSYSVYGETERYFMKIIPSVFMDTAKQSLSILLYLEERGFPSPRIILTKNGFPYIEVEETGGKTIVVLFEFIDGEEPNEGENVEAIGALVGQLHSIMKDYKGNLQVHGKEFFIDRYINILKKKNYDAGKTEMFREYGDILWKRVENLPRGFCHGDMYRGNLLRTSFGKYYILDFDTSCNAFPVYDIMVMCNSTNYFDFDENGYQKAKGTYETFLKGYGKYCALTDMEVRAFYDLIAVYHYQIQATIIEIYGLDCVDEKFLDKQLDWLMRWRRQCEINCKFSGGEL
jgi:Ser/Thr protein kinase RdoA (MazF antagonist)